MVAMALTAASVATAETITLWSGSQAATWGGDMVIETSKASGKCKAGDVIRVEYRTTGSYPTLKISRENPWKTWFEESVSGSPTDVKLTSQNLSELIGPIICMQGQDLTFTAVKVVTGGESGGGNTDPDPDPNPGGESAKFLDLDDAIYSGASRNGSQVKFERLGGMGWYYYGGKDFTGCKHVVFEFPNGAPAKFVMQVFYNDDLKVASTTVLQGDRQVKFDLTQGGIDPKDIYSVNLVSRSTNQATADFGRLYALDASGKEWTPSQSGGTTSLDDVIAPETLEVEYFNLQGMRLSNPEGLVIVRTTYSDGTVTTEKRIVRVK